jgi:hypothetical protein
MMLRICNRIINDSLKVCNNVWQIRDMRCLLPFVWSKFNIPDTVRVVSVPAVRWLVVMTDFFLFSFGQKGQWVNIRYRECVRGIKRILKNRHWQHIIKYRHHYGQMDVIKHKKGLLMNIKENFYIYICREVLLLLTGSCLRASWWLVHCRLWGAYEFCRWINMPMANNNQNEVVTIHRLQEVLKMLSTFT